MEYINIKSEDSDGKEREYTVGYTVEEDVEMEPPGKIIIKSIEVDDRKVNNIPSWDEQDIFDYIRGY